jgi:putative Mn2+ efflux pump MntP
MKRALQIGGVLAGIVLIVFGAVVIYMGIDGRNTVHNELAQQKITGTPDMTPSAIATEANQAGLTDVSLPTCDVANQPITNGTKARCFAEYMRIHALEATGGKVYSEMPRYATADGKGTNDPNLAQKGPNGQPLDNSARDVWVTQTALSTALDMSYMAEQLSLFSIVIGVALLLTGIGFIVVALAGSALPYGIPVRRAKAEPAAPAAG